MGIAINYFGKLFGRLDVKKDTANCKISLNFHLMGEKLDFAQHVLDSQVWTDIKKYMPIDTGALIGECQRINALTHGEVYVVPSESDYGHYQYEGIKYVDPKFGVSGFYGILEGKEGQWWSRKGVKKVPTGEPLFYNNPMAEAHWDEAAYNNHKREWVAVAKRAIK